MRLKIGIAIVALVAAQTALAETLTNAAVIALTTSGLDADAIIAKIQSSDTKFDLSTQQLITLKKRGVPSSVISAMLAAENHSRGSISSPTPVATGSKGRAAGSSALSAARPAGIYLLSGSQLVRLEPNVSGQTKTGGFLGSALSYGIAKISTRIVIQGESARVTTNEASPTFYFYLPAGVNRASSSSFDEQAASEPVSPNQFGLIHMSQKHGGREARIGRGNISGFQSGVVDKDRVNFTYDEARPGVFAVRPAIPLAAGEYCFVMIGSGGASVTRLFDFSVRL